MRQFLFSSFFFLCVCVQNKAEGNCGGLQLKRRTAPGSTVPSRHQKRLTATSPTTAHARPQPQKRTTAVCRSLRSAW